MARIPAVKRPGTGPVMIGVSGIRGIVGEGLTPDLIVAFAQAAGTFWGPGPVMVGRDSRTTGEMVKSAVFSGLAAVGCDPVDLGLCPTPTVQMAVEKHKAVGGIVVTASHNPKEWNALKLIGPSGLFLDEKEGKTVQCILEENRIRRVKWDAVGRVRRLENAVEDHIAAVLGLPFLDIRAIQKRRFRVALDTVNGAGATILPELLDRLGCRVFGINLQPTGIFAHTPEPLPENLSDLSRLVLEKRADIGLASDPDVDRMAMVAETGEPIGE
jgi:phosphomannomutase